MWPEPPSLYLQPPLPIAGFGSDGKAWRWETAGDFSLAAAGRLPAAGYPGEFSHCVLALPFCRLMAAVAAASVMFPLDDTLHAGGVHLPGRYAGSTGAIRWWFEFCSLQRTAADDKVVGLPMICCGRDSRRGWQKAKPGAACSRLFVFRRSAPDDYSGRR